jgi:hypothetical protein
MSFENWSKILKVLAKKPDHIFSLEELEDATGIEKQNLQHALYRAYRRNDVERIAPGLYRFHKKYNRRNSSKAQSIGDLNRVHIESPDSEYEIRIPNVSIRVIDEIIGQLKYIRNQLAHKK